MARAGLLPKALVRHFDNTCTNPNPKTYMTSEHLHCSLQAKMSEKQVPYWSVIWSGGLAGILALLLNLDSLWDFVSIVSHIV